MKVVLLGDSILTRWGRESIQTFESSVKEADVYNCAVGGWDSADGRGRRQNIKCLRFAKRSGIVKTEARDFHKDPGIPDLFCFF